MTRITFKQTPSKFKLLQELAYTAYLEAMFLSEDGRTVAISLGQGCGFVLFRVTGHGYKSPYVVKACDLDSGTTHGLFQPVEGTISFDLKEIER